jgi:hypothetical protein
MLQPEFHEKTSVLSSWVCLVDQYKTVSTLCNALVANGQMHMRADDGRPDSMTYFLIAADEPVFNINKSTRKAYMLQYFIAANAMEIVNEDE